LKEFTPETLIRKLSKTEGWAIVLICIGLLLLLMEKWSAIHGIRDLFKIVDSFVLPGIGIGILITNSRKIKSLRSSYVKLDVDSFSFHSRGHEVNIQDLSSVKEIAIKLDEIVVTDVSGSVHTLLVSEYIGEGEKNEIKALFSELKKKL